MLPNIYFDNHGTFFVTLLPISMWD